MTIKTLTTHKIRKTKAYKVCDKKSIEINWKI